MTANHDDHPARPAPVGWRVHTGSPPVAIGAADPDWPLSDDQLLHDLAGAFAYGFQQIESTWSQAHTGCPLAGYVIRLHSRPSASQATVEISVEKVDTTTGGFGLIAEVDLSVDAANLVETANTDLNACRSLMADAVGAAASAAGLRGESVDVITAAWKSMPPTLAVKLVHATTAHTDLPNPWALDEAMVSNVDREIAKRVQAQGVTPGTYAGDAAKALDRDALAPAALSLLTERLAQHGVEDILVVGMQQLERVIAAKERNGRNLQQALRTMTIGWDPIDHLRRNEQDHLVLRRAGEIVLEAALREEPSGDQPVDRLAWMELLAAARGYLEATSRSEAVHHQVRPTALQITDFYEIRTVPPPVATSTATSVGTGRVYDLNLERYQRARAEHMSGSDEPDAVDERADRSSRAADARTKSTLAGGIVDADVDVAMFAVYGISGTDLLAVLFALGHWPLPDDGPDVATISIEAIIAFVLDATVLGEEESGQERIRAAISMLSSDPAELRAADWRPWHARTRQRRLLTRPLVRLRDDFVVLAPHLCIASVGVYTNYLRQGLLPWSAPEPPRVLSRALEAMRDRRNRALEDDVVAVLRDGGYAVRSRVGRDDHARLGVPSLTGEIDAIAALPGSPIIWLLEVKDPTDTHVVPEIRRHLDKFYADGSGKPSHLGQLTAKLADLAPHADQVAQALGLPPRASGDPYRVEAHFVTRQPVPAAFTGCAIPFTTLPRLLRDLETSV